jgi:hypothetical protein
VNTSGEAACRDWLERRAHCPPATAEEYAALVAAAADFSTAALRDWW